MESDEFYEACIDLSRMEASERQCNATLNPPSLTPISVLAFPPPSPASSHHSRERSDWNRGPGVVFASQPCSAWTGPFFCRLVL